MKMKHIVGVIGIVITITGWIIGNSDKFHVVNRLLAPKYHNASIAYKKMHSKGFVLQENDIGFREISKIIENRLEGDNIPTLIQIKTVNFGTLFVNTENGQETQKFIEFELTFANNMSISGKIRMLDEKIKDNYLTKQLFTCACCAFWLGIIISSIAVFI